MAKADQVARTHCFSTVGLFRADRCRNFCFHVWLVDVKQQCADRGERCEAAGSCCGSRNQITGIDSSARRSAASC